MRLGRWFAAVTAALVCGSALALAGQASQPVAEGPVRLLVARLDLEKYKATVKGLTRFGDRRQGTDRNRAAIDWIEAQLEETGLNGSRASVEQRRGLQGREDPPGSGRYPEPRWLGMVQHDMMMFDHGMPREDGTLSPEQRPEADVNVEFAGTSKMTAASQELAWLLRAANDRYATDYPAAVGNRMQSTDSVPFQDDVAAISLRENERGAHLGTGWNPHWHQPTDVYSTFSDKDFRLGLNAAQTTLAAIAQLAGATLKRRSSIHHRSPRVTVQ